MQSLSARRFRPAHFRNQHFRRCNIHNPLTEGHRQYMRPKLKISRTSRRPAQPRRELDLKILELTAKGKLKEIEHLLSESERILVRNVLLKRPKTYAQIARIRDREVNTIYSASYRLLDRLKRWESGQEFKRTRGREKGKPLEGRLVKRIKKIIAERIAKGETLEEIKKNAKLNEIQCKLLDIYVLPEQRITLKEAARLTGRKKAGVMSALRQMENNLLGKNIDYRVERYLKLTDDELTEKIRSTGAKTRTELSQSDARLKMAAKQRGLLNGIIISKHQKDLRAALNNALKERKLDDVLASLTDLEKAIINNLLAKKPLSREELAKLHNTRVSQLQHAEKRLTKKLKGEEITLNDLEKLRKSVKELGDETIVRLRAQMTDREIAILERRVNREKPDSSKDVGQSFLISRERIRHAQIALYHKLENYKAAGNFELPEHLKDAFFA